MGCVHSTRAHVAKKHGSDTEQEEVHKNTDSEIDPEILQLAELAKGERHAFTEKSFRAKRACDVCRQNIDNPGAFCKDCKVAIHKKCENKVTTTCISAPDLGSTKSTSQKKRCSLPRSKSVERVMERVMERHYDFDLTYITERIISVFFLPDLEEQRYRRNLQEVAAMLKSKHQDKFLLLNLSEKRHDITRLNPKVQDYGWPDLHAPPLDRICAVCKAMETWLTSDPVNVVVLHCKGNKGKTGVIVAAYMHYSKITAGADQALTTLAMRKFCEDKVSTSLQPSQNRYIYYFGGLLSGSIKMNSSPLFLHQILLPSLPNFQVGGGYYPFLKIYQSLQLVYTSGIYDPQSSTARKLCITMEPALLLKGDIMVRCYHRRPRGSEREVVFRVQFHTCTVHGAQLWFGKTELDMACTDDRFPPDATVEFVFSNSAEKMKGREYRKNDPAIKVDYNISDPVVRWDSYENFNLHHQDSLENISHTKGPLDGSLYAQVRKRRGPSGVSPNGCLPDSPTVKPQPPSQTQSHGTQPLSFSSDSGHSSAQSDHLEEPPLSPSCRDREETKCPSNRGEGENKAKGEKERDRETAILDDGDLSSPSGLKRSCGRCGEGGQKAERERCLAKCHCCSSSTKNNPKSRTLPALPSKSVSPPLCHRHSAHAPLPELPWERPPIPLPCLHSPCYPYPTPEHAHPHSHTLPASNRLCTGEDCHLFHYSSHGPPSSRLSHQSLPSSPYREVFFSPPATSPGCPCQDCTNRREHQSASVRTFHPLHPDQIIESPHWAREAGVQQRTRQGPALWEAEHPWEAEREVEFWQRRVGNMPSYHACHSHLEQRQSLDQRGFVFGPHQSYDSPRSLMDMRDGTSSGYNTPPPPRHSCPCSPYQASPAESHESRGYASGYHSGSGSPLPPTSPNAGTPGGSVPESPSGVRDQQRPKSHIEEHTQADTEDHISQGSAEKSDSNRQVTCSTPGLDSDQDYTVISSSPTHTEDSVTELKIADSPEQRSPSQIQDPNQGTSASVSVDSNANSDSTATQTPTETTAQSQSSSSTPKDSAQTADLSPGLSKNVEENVTGGVDGSNPSETLARTPVIIPRSRSLQPGVPGIQMQINGSAIPDDSQCNNSRAESLSSSSSHSSTPTSPNGTPDRRSFPQAPSLAAEPSGRRLTPDRDSAADTKPPSPVPDGYCTPTFPMASYYYPLLNVPRVPYTGYTAITIPAIQPPLPEKKRLSSTPGTAQNGHNSLLRVSSAPSPPSPPHHVTFSTSAGDVPPPLRRGSAQSSETDRDSRVNSKFVQDSSKYWYKPGITRDQAIAVLKDKEPGAFLIRDSNSFQGAYGLALKVATPPPNANLTGNKGDPLEQLVRHFLIETGPRGVKIKGCQNESYFGSLSALVYQHSITPISLPCALRVPEKDLVGELQEIQSSTSTSTAADLLKQGAACNVLYLNSVETESLTGPQAISKATKCTLALSPRPTPTVVHFKVSAQGITLTDSKRRLFFRRHYPINSVTFSSLDPQDQRWINSDSTSCKMFGFVARRTGSATENVCHLFAEMDPEQPAVAIVNFINKVMLGLQQRR